MKDADNVVVLLAFLIVPEKFGLQGFFERFERDLVVEVGGVFDHGDRLPGVAIRHFDQPSFCFRVQFETGPIDYRGHILVRKLFENENPQA